MDKVKKYFDYRMYWMGFAMLWIVFFHSEIQCASILTDIRKIGYGGVDIFMFASGIGNYYSYQKYGNPLDFLKRKIGRLAPSYLPFILVWLLYQALAGGNVLRISIGNILGLQGFSNYGGQFNWYISGILLCYILTPYLAEFVKREGLIKDLILLAVLIISSFAFWEDTQLIIVFTRLPIFFMGMMCAKYGDEPMKRSYVILSELVCVAGFAILLILWRKGNNMLWNYGLYWYPYILITPGLCVLISRLVNTIESRAPLKRVFSPMLALLKLSGKCSFEIFLVHILCFDILNRVISKYQLSHVSLLYCAAVLLAIGGACVYHQIIEKIKKAR